MSEKATAAVATEKTSRRTHAMKQNGGPSPRLVSGNPFSGLQQSLGNQAMLELLESGTIQAKLRVSQPGDPDELEADRIAEKVVTKSRAPVIGRKCACDGGSPCSKCAGEQEEETINRRVATPQLRSLQPSIQRVPADPTSAAAPVPAGPEKQPPGAKTSGKLVVEDNATRVESYQMRKSQFIALLRTEACAAADAALASVKHTTKGCPYVAKWLSFYEKQSGEHIERAIHKYAPEAATARSAREAIRLLVARVERAAITWAKTGKVEGVPKELAGEFPGQGGFLGSVNRIASSKVGGAILGFIGGTKKQEDLGQNQVQRKARNGEAAPPHDAAGVKKQLGSGHFLDSRVQSQMSTAFGRDFSGVRVHTDAGAARLSSDLQARAFTVGNDVAFASGEYRPGTLIGDALIAHELAHVVQQSGATIRGPLRKDDSGARALEDDADVSAIHAVTSLAANAKFGLAYVSRKAMPALKSGLQLQRCASARPRASVLGSAEGAKTSCDMYTGEPIVRYHGNAPDCLSKCIEVHEQVHVRQQKAECMKKSAAFQKLVAASHAERANTTPETRKAAYDAYVEFKKAEDFFEHWLNQNRPRHEAEAYRATLACAEAPDVEGSCRAQDPLGYKGELELWYRCARSPEECDNP